MSGHGHFKSEQRSDTPQLVFDIYDRRKTERGVVRSNPTLEITGELEATST